MTKKQLIIGAAAVTIFVVAAIAWTTRYEYRNGPSVCVHRIDRWTGQVHLGCPGQDWRPVGKSRSAKITIKPAQNASTDMASGDADSSAAVTRAAAAKALQDATKAARNAQEAAAATAGTAAVQVNASDEELMAVFNAPTAPSPTASEAEKAFRDATFGKAAKSAESQLFGPRPLADR